jgi:parallel beta-helix repeat protein
MPLLGSCVPPSDDYRMKSVSFKDTLSSSYEYHEPISITNDAELAAIASNGTGATDDPYILEQWKIDATNTNGLYITGSTKYFIIRNCWIEGTSRNYYGIYLNQIANNTAHLVNNTCRNNLYGIYIRYSDSVTVFNNFCQNNYNSIYLYHSSYSSITGNICSDNEGIGIYLHDSSGYAKVDNNICNRNKANGIRILSSVSCSVINNSCSQNYPHGIILFSADHSRITRNVCYNNSLDGLVLYRTSFSFVSNNTCYMNSRNGIYYQRNSDTNEIFWNILLDNYLYGIMVRDGSKENQIYQNNFLNNGFELISQAYDNSTNNLWEENYWSDYNGSGKYSIAGTTKSNDTSPLLEPVDLELLLPLKERVLTTNEGIRNIQSYTPVFMPFTLLLACFLVLLLKGKRNR